MSTDAHRRRSTIGLPRKLQLYTLIGLTVAGACLLLSVVVDRAVALVVPAIPVRVAHPPNFREHRKSIEFSVDFRTNSQGLRYREIPLDKQSEHEFRVAVLGDSVTEGWGVEADATFSAVLERDLSNANRTFYFINHGLAGAGPLEYGRILAVVGLKYHPDLVLVVLHTNDLSDTPEGADLNLVRNWRGAYEVATPKLLWPPGDAVHRAAYFLWPWSYARLQNLSHERARDELGHLGFMARAKEVARRSGISEADISAWEQKIPREILEACEHNEFDPAKVMMGCLYPDRATQELDIHGALAERQWTSMRHLLGQIAELCRTERLPVAVIYTPTAFQYDETVGNLRKQLGVRVRREWLTEPSSELERRILQWAEESHVPYLSLTDAFRRAASSSPGRFNFPMDEHWTVEGHQLAAQTIGKWMAEQKLLDERPREDASR
jgi:lysophospholipase L1-like esterase